MAAKPKMQTLVAGLLILTPLAMTVARRSSTLLIVMAAATTLIIDRQKFAERWRAMRLDPALLAGLALIFTWAAVSLLWSPLPARGMKQLVFDFALPTAAGLVLLVQGHGTRPSSQAGVLFALSLTLAALSVAAQLHFQIRLEELFTPSPHPAEPWRFNMVVVTMALLVPALLLQMRSSPVAAAIAILAIIVAIVLSQSATSKLALICGCVGFVLFRALPRRLGLMVFGTVLFGLLVIQPWQGRLVEQSLLATGQTEILFQSAKERVVIWKATGEMARHAMPWGTGMGSSDAVSDTAFAKTMPPELWTGLRQTHAHDAFLNIVMELGLPGLIGLLLIAFGLIRTLGRLPNELFAPSVALAAQIIAVDLVSHGAWQSWWFTAIALAFLALRQCVAKRI